jgi:hypothetical protein
MLRVGNATIVAGFHALAAGNALVGIDPIFGVFKANGLHRTAGTATMTGGAKLLFDYIRHLFSSKSYDFSQTNLMRSAEQALRQSDSIH